MKPPLETYTPETRLYSPEELDELRRKIAGPALLADMLAEANPDTIHDL